MIGGHPFLQHSLLLEEVNYSLKSDLLSWRDQLAIGGVPVNSQKVKKQNSAIQSIEHYVRLTRE